VAWLSVQTYSNTDEEIALQHAIWNVFGSVSATPSPEYDAYVNAANAAAVGGYLNFDFSGFVFVEQVGGYPGSTPPSEQAFVFTTTPPTITTAAPTPEPGTISLLAAGGLLILAGRRSRKPASPRGSRS
jgi:PEP-CTERM motif